MHKFKEETIATQKIFDGKIIQVQVDDVRLPNGQISKREIVKHSGAVAIIPITEDGRIIFVEQYRKPLEKPLVEIPAGKLEPGEEPHMTALRELEEETGYTTEDLTYVTSFYTSPGFADEIMYIYLAKQLKLLEHPVAGDEDEFIKTIALSLNEAKQYIQKERIHDAKTAYALLYVELMGYA